MATELCRLEGRTEGEDYRGKSERCKEGRGPHCVSFCKSIYATPGPVSPSPTVHYSGKERGSAATSRQQSGELEELPCFKPLFLFSSKNCRLLVIFSNELRCKFVCPPPQEKVHFDSVGHHFGKLGEEGKIGHRVIDLTRPEDLDGKASSSFSSSFSSSQLLSSTCHVSMPWVCERFVDKNGV